MGKKACGMGLGKKGPATKNPTKEGPTRTNSTKKKPTMEEPKDKEPDKGTPSRFSRQTLQEYLRRKQGGLTKRGLLLLEKKELHEYRKGLLEKKRKLTEERDRARVNKHRSSRAEIKYALAAARISEMEEEILHTDVAIDGFDESQSADSQTADLSHR